MHILAALEFDSAMSVELWTKFTF